MDEAPSLNCFKTWLDKFGLTKMLCMTLKHHSWEPELEVILSLIVSFYYIMYIDVGIEVTACTCFLFRWPWCSFREPEKDRSRWWSRTWWPWPGELCEELWTTMTCSHASVTCTVLTEPWSGCGCFFLCHLWCLPCLQMVNGWVSA